jgi:uncharacterized protein
MEGKQPIYGNGKICYLEIPATDIKISADFYHHCFGWKIRNNSDGHVSFDDGVGEVSGMWVLGKNPISEGTIIISIMVNDAEITKKLITKHGGNIIFSDKMKSGEVIAHFIDPAGNFMGIYQSA